MGGEPTNDDGKVGRFRTWRIQALEAQVAEFATLLRMLVNSAEAIYDRSASYVPSSVAIDREYARLNNDIELASARLAAYSDEEWGSNGLPPIAESDA